MNPVNHPGGMLRSRTLRWLAALCVIAACGEAAPDGPPIADLSPVESPALPGSGEPNLATGPDGTAYLSWLEPSEMGHALRFTTWDGAGWGEPRTIIDRTDLFVNWADFPSMAVFADGTLAAHWLEKSGPGTYAYDVRMALSGDGGASWSEDIIPHRDGVQAEHGFVSLVPLHDGLAVLWLDGRATVDGEPMTLRSTTVAPDGALGPDVLADSSVCDCCQTAMARTRGGLVAAYRDRTGDEVRDIYVARYAGGEWSEGRPVHRDGWVIDACPVNGPAVAARGDTVAVAWFTAAPAPRQDGAGGGEGHPRASVAFSEDGGASFGDPVRVDDGQPMGRVDVLLLADGTALVSWLERTEDGAEVRVRRAGPEGAGPARAVTTAAAERATGFPRMVPVGDRLVLAWTEPGEAGGVRTAVARLAGARTDGDR